MLSHFLRATKKTASFIAGASAVTAGSTTLVCNTPTGAITGDLLVAFMVGGDPVRTFTQPAGWTEQLDANGRAIASLASYDGTTMNYTFTMSGSDTMRVQILCFRNATWGIVGTPSASVTSPVAPSITIPNNDSLWLVYTSSTDVGMTYTTPSGFSDIVAAQSTTVTQKLIVNNTLQLSGATATVTMTRTAGSFSGRAVQLSISSN